MRQISAAVLLAAAALPAAEAVLVPLTTVPLADTSGQAFCRLRDGSGAIPFANAVGTLRLRRDGANVRFDSDGDGDIDADDAPAIAGRLPTGSGGSVQIAVLWGGKPATVQIRIGWSDARYVMIESASALQAVVDGTVVQLIDGDVDGLIGGPEDRIRVASGPFLPMSRLVAVGGRLLAIEAAEDGSTATFSAWAGTPSRISLALAAPLPPRPGLAIDSASLTLVHEEGLMALELQSGHETLAAPGRYRIKEDQLELRTRGDHVFLRGDGDRVIELGPEPLQLQRGIPNRLGFAAGVDAAGTASVTSVWLEDGHGGRWRADGDGSTTQLLLRGNGSDRPVQKLEYG